MFRSSPRASTSEPSPADAATEAAARHHLPPRLHRLRLEADQRPATALFNRLPSRPDSSASASGSGATRVPPTKAIAAFSAALARSGDGCRPGCGTMPATSEATFNPPLAPLSVGRRTPQAAPARPNRRNGGRRAGQPGRRTPRARQGPDLIPLHGYTKTGDRDLRRAADGNRLTYVRRVVAVGLVVHFTLLVVSPSAAWFAGTVSVTA